MSLINKPNELIKYLNERLIPRENEKKTYGEVFQQQRTTQSTSSNRLYCTIVLSLTFSFLILSIIQFELFDHFPFV